MIRARDQEADWIGGPNIADDMCATVTAMMAITSKKGVHNILV